MKESARALPPGADPPGLSWSGRGPVALEAISQFQPGAPPAPERPLAQGSGSPDRDGWNWLGDLADPTGLLDLDLGGCLLFIVLGALVAVLAAALVVVWAAPVLLAEVLLDALLIAGLYKRLRGLETGHWLATVVRRTWLPALHPPHCRGLGGGGRVAPAARPAGGGGLLVSQLITLYITPVYYIYLDSLGDWIRRRAGRLSGP